MFRFIFIKIDDIFSGSAIPEGRGTAESYGGAGHFPRTPSRHSSLPPCGRTGREGQV